METSALKHDPARALQGLSRHILADGYDILADMAKSRGSRIYDAKRDLEFLDFFSCFATIPLGYNPLALTTPEAIDRLGRAAINKPSNSDLYTWEMVEFIETFASVAKGGFRYSFFIEGGALAVENCLKAAFDWKVQKNLAKGIEGEKGYQVIHFREAFHGRSGYTLSLTNTDPSKTNYFPKFDWPRIDNPKCRFPLSDSALAQVEEAEAEALRQIEAAVAKDPAEIACIILEPIQCEGGDNYFRPEFHRRIRSICDENDILMIYDEVQTGFGATGKFWCFEHYVQPDLVAFGKKSQVCGVLASERLDEVPNNVFRVSSRINSTWGGSLVDMVRCTMYLEEYRKENLLESVRDNGKRLLAELHNLQGDFPHMVANARGLGLLAAFDLPDAEKRRDFLNKLFELRLLMLPCGQSSVRFRPALNTPWPDLEEGLSIVRKALEQL